ncbi:MAG: InlB B-repeat-containing protein, partial [Candidatus Riflebacteria bacterium]|nr:InlB B-repeat-containing protein [Candidatus Riflebacteria bacterium]
MKKYISLLMAVILIATLLGCHAGGNSPMAPDNSATTVLPETRTVGTNGSFTDITFPSGAVIKCPNDKTFQEGVKVTATEEKVPVITDNSGKFSYIYVYNISAVLPSENSLSADVSVNTIEKPLSVSLPNDNTAGTCYIGTRASESDPWRYSLATDGLNSNARFMRLSANSPKTCTFNLFRLNIQFRLFVFDNENKKDEVQVDTIAIVPAEDVEIKDGKYTGKLTVKLNLEGENLNDLKAEDLIAKITYRSENLQGANIDFTTNKNDSSDKAVTGSYEHSFEISNIKVENTLGNTAELSFELNLDGVSLDDFPKDFLVEFYSKGSDENTRPFEYTQAFSFETKENEPAPEPEPEPEPLPAGAYSIKYELNGGTLAEGVTNPRSYTEDSDTIVLNNPDKKGYTFTGWSESDNDAPQNPMSIVHGSKGDKTFIASYTPKNYIITLDPKGGTLKKDSIEYNIETEEFTLPTPTKDSYTFDGWTGSNGDTPERVVKIEKGTTGDKTYTANYSAVAYTITYTLGADDVINDNPTGFNSDTETFTLNEPTRTGYTFTGWTGSNGNTPQKEVTIAKGTTEKKSYTANWSINSYNLTLKHYRGSGVNTVSGDGLHEYNSEVTASCTLAAGFEFDSWFDSEGNKMPDKFKMPAKDLTLSACGKPIVYKITYNLDNGALPQGVTNPTTYDVTTADFTLNNPTKNGYDFIGWSGTGLTGNNNTTVTVSKGSTGAREYTANYTPNNYTITYNNIDGATFATANPTIYNVETETFTLTNPTKDDYIFLGWTYEGQTTPTTSVTISQGSTGDKEYTAHFNLLLTLKIASDTGAVFDPVENNLYKFSPTFTITPSVADGITLSETDKASILSAISVKDSADTAVSSVSKSWNNGNIALSFSQDLSANATYTISCGDIDGMAITCTSLSFTTFYFKGMGTSGDPYQVENAAQLALVSNYNSCHFKQMNDINLEDIEKWVPLCGEYDNSYNPVAPFTGSYDGNSKKIKNLKIHSSDYMEYAGLFGFVNAGTIKNLTVDGFSIRGASADTPLNVYYIGIIAAQIENGSSITDCHITDSRVTNATDSASIASLTPYAGNLLYAGGICSGNYSGTISNCSVGKCKIICSVDNADGVYLGGICCSNSGSISNCDIDELIISCSVNELQLNECLGGICADNTNSSEITNCSVKNTSITGSKGNSGDLYLGGISSQNIGRIEICDVQNTTVKGTGNSRVNAGGISSYNGGGAYSDSITSCHVEDSVVESQGYRCNVGGVAGTATSITSCYIDNTTVKSNGNSCNIGGISADDAAISKCYVTSSEITESSENAGCQIGGISGRNAKNITSSYVINTNVKGSGLKSGSSTYDYVGGICGYFYKSYNYAPTMSNCYVYEDNNHSISKIDSTGAGKLGYLVGLLYKYDSNPDSNAKVTDSFCNIATPNGLSDLVNSVGSSGSSTALPDDNAYLNEYIKNCYGGIT